LKIDELIIYRYDGTSLALSHLDTLSKDAKASANKVMAISSMKPTVITIIKKDSFEYG